MRKHGKTEVARPNDIRVLEERYAAPGRLAEAHARGDAEDRAGVARGGGDRAWPTLAGGNSKPGSGGDVQGVTTASATGIVTSGYFCCAEQLELQSHIVGMDMSGLQAIRDLAGDGQAHTAFVAASRWGYVDLNHGPLPYQLWPTASCTVVIP